MTNSTVFLSQTHSHCELNACGLTLNIGRQRLTDSQFQSLLEKAHQAGVLEAQQKMVNGEVVNASENRQALHTSLRSLDPTSPHFEEVETTR